MMGHVSKPGRGHSLRLAMMYRDCIIRLGLWLMKDCVTSRDRTGPEKLYLENHSHGHILCVSFCLFILKHHSTHYPSAHQLYPKYGRPKLLPKNPQRKEKDKSLSG